MIVKINMFFIADLEVMQNILHERTNQVRPWATACVTQCNQCNPYASQL